MGFCKKSNESQTLTLGVPPQLGIWKRPMHSDGGGGQPPEDENPNIGPFELVAVRMASQYNYPQIRLGRSTLGGRIPGGVSWNQQGYAVIALNGNNYVYGRVTVSGGEVTGSDIVISGGTQTSSGNTHYVLIGSISGGGSYNATTHNDRTGPIGIVACGSNAIIH